MKKSRNLQQGREVGVDRVSGSFLYAQTVAGTSPSSILIGPSMFPRTNTISSVFQNFRFTKMSIYLLPSTGQPNTTGDPWVMGYASDVSANIAGITSAAVVSECTPSAMQGYTGTNSTNFSSFYPRDKIFLNRKQLLSETSLKWYKCVGDTDTNAWENFQGQLIFYNEAALPTTFRFWVDYVIEFTSPISSVLTLSGLPLPIISRSVVTVPSRIISNGKVYLSKG